MGLRKCKECGEMISSSAKTCPKCGKKQGSTLSFILGLILIVIFIFNFAGKDNPAKSTGATSAVNNNQVSTKPVQSIQYVEIGETVKTDKFEITIISIEERSQVGATYFSSKPSEGGTYIAINWKYKNISDKPIGMFSFPIISLIDGKGIKYSTDISATSSFATETDDDSKIASDLNPGITVKDSKVFEISSELFAVGGWQLKIAENTFIKIN
jgi:hypothetical protein